MRFIQLVGAVAFGLGLFGIGYWCAIEPNRDPVASCLLAGVGAIVYVAAEFERDWNN